MAKEYQQEMFDEKHNAANYRKCLEPFVSPEEANNELEAFWNEFYELRNKYGIPDMLVTLMFSIATEDDEVQHLAMFSCGSDMNVERMAAYAHGRASAQAKELMGRYLSMCNKAKGKK